MKNFKILREKLMNEKVQKSIWMIFMIIFFIFLYIFNSTLSYTKPADAPEKIVFEKAKVIKIISEKLDPDPNFANINIGKQELELEIISGENSGKTIILNNFIGRVDNKPAKMGTKLVISSFDGFITGIIVNYSREGWINVLVLLFMFVLLLFGKSKGIKAIVSLVFTMICIIFLFIPMIIRGVNPIVASIFIVILSTIVTMLSLNGLSKKTIVASLSCILGTMIAGIIAYIFGDLTNVSTYNTAEAEDLLFVASNTFLQVKDLLFAGILIASLGAVMDTTMSITSSAFEMYELNPDITSTQIFKSCMNVGKDVMGTMTNTLILAFTGSSINILIIYFMYNMPYLQLINIDLIVIEIIQGLSGGIAIVLATPITAFACSKLIGKKPIYDIKENSI